MFGLTFLGDMLVAVGAYVLSIYTWPVVHGWWLGAEGQIRALEAKLASLRK